MIRCLLLLLSWCIVGITTGQTSDTLRVMHYNLLNYRNTTGQCTESTNNAVEKEKYLAKIVKYAAPDILTVNEMGANWLNPNKLLTNSLNVDGVDHFDQAEFTNNSFSSLVNMLFFNKERLVLKNQETIEKDSNGRDLVRVVDVYHLYYKDEEALKFGDTTFVSCLVVHLKAGSSSSDKSERALCANAIMRYLEANKKTHSYILCGDFNVQSSNEDSYRNLVTHNDLSIRFVDPVDAPGSWNNNSNYANLHTQSTHVSDTRGGCFSSGGMDDRFDFILCGKEVMDNSYRVKFVPGTYRALGQDSRRFNGDILTPSNSLIPNDVANALYNMSDHLPVLMDLQVKNHNSGMQPLMNMSGLIVVNKEEEIEIFFPNLQVNIIQILDMQGKEVYSRQVLESERSHMVQRDILNAGIYIIQAETNDHGLMFKKILIPN